MRKRESEKERTSVCDLKKCRYSVRPFYILADFHGVSILADFHGVSILADFPYNKSARFFSFRPRFFDHEDTFFAIAFLVKPFEFDSSEYMSS
jgi:hypothetical protein